MDLQAIKRVVVKVGTSTLTYSTGKLNLRRIEQLVRCLADLKNRGYDVVLVSSGAMGVGVGKLSLQCRPEDIPGKQAVAAVGQCELMSIYDRMFAEYCQTVAQILLTKTDLETEQKKKNVTNTFDQLLAYGTIPIVNENDTVATEEIEFGDNDTLSAMVAECVGADLLVIITDIDGLYDKNPAENDDAKLISEVSEITTEVFEIAGGSGSNRGTGGMYTKLQAAQIAKRAGIATAIISGNDLHNIYKLIGGEPVGTVFTV